MSTKTVYDVIDTGVNYLLSVYDSWNIEDVLDKENDVFPNTLHWQFGHVLTIFDLLYQWAVKMPLISKRILNYLVMVLVLQIGRDKTYHQLNRLKRT